MTSKRRVRQNTLVAFPHPRETIRVNIRFVPVVISTPERRIAQNEVNGTRGYEFVVSHDIKAVPVKHPRWGYRRFHLTYKSRFVFRARGSNPTPLLGYFFSHRVRKMISGISIDYLISSFYVSVYLSSGHRSLFSGRILKYSDINTMTVPIHCNLDRACMKMMHDSKMEKNCLVVIIVAKTTAPNSRMV